MVVPLTAWTAGCGDDSSQGGLDASTVTPPPVVSADSAAPSATATPVTVYVGNVAALDGSASTGPGTLAYAWTLKTVPAGSAMTTAWLIGANTANVSFTPDKPGAYEAELAVTAEGQTATTTTTATAVDPPIFYFDSAADGGTSFGRLLVTGATAGDGGTPVACFERTTATYQVERAASAGSDWWEAPAGQPSKAAFIFEATVDGGEVATLFAATSAGSCATPPTKLDQVPFRAAPQSGVHGFEQPRISPDGNRVAYVRQAPEGARVATIGLDGTDLRMLGSRFADADGGADPDASLDQTTTQSRPFWMGNTHVAWIESLTQSSWQVVRAADAPNATREILARCSSDVPTMAAFLPNGDLLVAQGNGAMGLVAYPIVAATKTCGAARLVTPDAGDLDARDFQLSPDGTEVAHLAIGAGIDKQVFITRVDGTGAPRRVADVGEAQRGPRWVGNGAFVSWGALPGQALDAGVEAGAIVVARAESGAGPAPLPIHVPVRDNSAEAIGNGIYDCSFGHAAGSGVAFAGVACVALLRVLRRRRR